MDKIVIVLGVVVLGGLLSILGGTIVFLLWPVAVPLAFPGLVASGVLAGKLSWWTAVALTWLLQIFFKATQTNNNK